PGEDECVNKTLYQKGLSRKAFTLSANQGKKGPIDFAEGIGYKSAVLFPSEEVKVLGLCAN
ncbi:MAG: hypothetical protein JW775_10045, partial [Candidatus Aminicenantes bacterium]|nr:hypothetical protein [Candidatus Aminicenantes bacterium]